MPAIGGLRELGVWLRQINSQLPLPICTIENG
jgi:hypothetical protein